MTHHDVIVVGGGIVGCAIAAKLARERLSVCLVERDVIGGAATAASMGHLVVLDDDPAELVLSAYSSTRWRELAPELPAAAEYRATGTLWVACDDDELAEARRKQVRLAGTGIASDIIDAAALAAHEPALRRGLAGGLRVPGDAVVYPPVAAAFLARRAMDAGAHIVIGHAVRALTADGIELDDGRVLHAGAVVVANGCTAPDLVRCVPIRKRKGHLLVTARPSSADVLRVNHQLVELGYVKSAHGGDGDSVAFNVQPRPTGQLLLGSTRQFDDLATGITPRLLARLVERATEFLPGIGALPALRAWTGFRPTTPDHRPLIGRWPARERVWLACGHEGLGVTTALGTADLVAAQLTGAAPPFDPAPFDPARYAPEAAHA